MAPDVLPKSSVPTLFQQCLQFCAKNVDSIESLDGFPEDFGAKILETAIRLGKFDRDCAVTSNALRIFCESNYFTNLKLPNLMLLNEYESSMFAIIENVAMLDFTNVHLDDEHEVLDLIPSCRNLTVLVLESSNLKDKGMKKITYPCFGGKNLPRLSYLDISGLDLSAKFMKTLRHLPQLENIILLSEDEELTVPGFRRCSRPEIKKVENCRVLMTLMVRWTRIIMDRRKEKVEASEATSFYPKFIRSPLKDVARKNRGSKVMLQKHIGKLGDWQPKSEKRMHNGPENEIKSKRKITNEENVEVNILDLYR